jgi:hypothetical protein
MPQAISEIGDLRRGWVFGLLIPGNPLKVPALT